MKLLTFVQENQYRLGVKTERGILDVAAALSHVPAAKPIPVTIHNVIDGGTIAVDALQEYAEFVAGHTDDGNAYFLEESSLKLGPCVTHPNKMICIGLNYRKHAAETKMAIPEYPILFNKFNNTLAGHGEEIPHPKVSQKVDYEAELVIVMGKTAKYVTREEALSHVFGYCSVNDLSARDLQMRTHQWLLGKSCDKFSPLGPYLVTSDEVGDPNRLEIKSIVNGEVRQNSNTSDMIFTCAEIVSYISQHMSLVPGDLILTGTPEGVVMGYPPEKQVYLKPGDQITIEIEKLGSLTNTLIAEQ